MSDTQRIRHIDAWRFIAVSLVIVAHAIGYSNLRFLATGQYPTLSPWWTVGFVLCVWLFAHFSYQYFERPLIGVATRWSEAIKRRAFFGRSAGFAK